MRIVQQRHEVWKCSDGEQALKYIERVGRICYKSEHRISPDSYKAFVTKIIGRGHESVLEHEIISVWLLTTRAVSHELVRYRISSPTQESQRYIAYLDDKPGTELCFVENVTRKPKSKAFNTWLDAMCYAEGSYLDALAFGEAPEDARDILPNSAKTELVITANFREWRHILQQRTSNAAWAQTRSLMQGVLADLKQRIPVIFDDINVN